MAGVAWLALVVGVVTAEGSQSSTNTSSQDQGGPPPGLSMHRLIPSVVDTVSPHNHTETFSPGNITLDTSPFLPSGMVPSYRNAQHQETNISNALQPNKNFTPSFFIGEVIPEPYIPERFQTSRSGVAEKDTSRRSSNQKLVSSQTAFAIRKILPFIEHMKHAVGYSMGEEEEPLAHVPPVHEPLDHVPPVHEPSAEDEESSTPKYAVSYEDQHSDRPNYLPHFHTMAFNGDLQDSPGYPPHDPRDNINSHYGQVDHHKDHLVFNRTIPSKYNTDQYSGPYFAHENHEYHQKDQLDHFEHHGGDFVLPSPFYPPEHEYPTSHVHHKDVHYKVYQNKPKSALHGLLHFAAALIPLGLFVAALQPSVLHINSSQPMPAKYRSADGDSSSSSREVLGLPGLEALEKLGLGRLDGADCEKRAFCELAVLGSRPEGNTAQKGLWKLATSIPTEYAASLGLDQVLKAVKANSCSSLKCVGSNGSDEESVKDSSPRRSSRN